MTRKEALKHLHSLKSVFSYCSGRDTTASDSILIDTIVKDLPSVYGEEAIVIVFEKAEAKTKPVNNIKSSPLLSINIFADKEWGEISRITFSRSGGWYNDLDTLTQADILGDTISYLEDKRRALVNRFHGELKEDYEERQKMVEYNGYTMLSL